MLEKDSAKKALTCPNCASKTVGNAAEIAVSPFFGNTIGQITNFVVSISTCQRNVNFFKAGAVAFSAFSITKISGIWEYFFNSQSPIEKIPYKPFALSILDITSPINVFKNATKIKGTNESDLIMSHLDGSEVFAVGGLNYLVANNGSDKFYFSRCSTDIIDKKVSVIEGFNISCDTILIFCTKASTYLENITILHEIINGTDVTYVHVTGDEKNSSIALIGNIELNNTDIVLNEKWPYTNEG